MSRSQKSSSNSQQQQQQQQKIPQISPDGLLIYGNGLVFGGNVYPVLVDGVPVQAPVGAQQAAAQQRWQMMHGPAMAQKPVNVRGQKTGQNLQQRPRQRQQQLGTGYPNMSTRHSQSFRPRTSTGQQSQSPTLTEYPARCPSAPSTMRRSNRGHGMQQQKQQKQQQQQQPCPQQQQQQPPFPSAMGGGYYNYGYNTNVGNAANNWNGYFIMQPMDPNRPYSFGFSPTD